MALFGPVFGHFFEAFGVILALQSAIRVVGNAKISDCVIFSDSFLQILVPKSHQMPQKTAEKPESQDLCLAEHYGSMHAFIDKYLPPININNLNSYTPI